MTEAHRKQGELINAELLELRKRIIAAGFPAINSEKGLLRKQLLDTFVQKRPKSRDEWLRRIDFALRNQTDHSQIPMYLDEILSIIAVPRRI